MGGQGAVLVNEDLPAAMGNAETSSRRQPPLFLQQVWFVRLRWVAGVGVLCGGLAQRVWLQWYETGVGIAIIGAVILAYNGGLWLLLRERSQRRQRRQLQGLAWLQIFADLTCLTCLTLWTGGAESPLLGLYALHMVFAALLLPREMAFAVAAVAIGMVVAGLAIAGQVPSGAAGMARVVGWALALLATVYVAGHITRDLRDQRRRLQRQNRRITAMTGRLRQQHQALVQQEKMVAMGHMAAGVAHEVSNPLASMDGLLQLMERKPEKVSPENLLRLREQVARVNAIVRQLTTFSRPDPGAWQTADLNTVVKHALGVLAFDRRLKAVTVETQLAAGLPAFAMLPAAIEQVVVNLVINAVDAMEKAEAPRLVVRTGAKVEGSGARGQGSVFVEVVDNGEGISEENRDRIFEPFFTTKPVGKGTGLGLSISYSLVKKHGGEITVASTPTKGTTFTVSLPLAGAGGEGVAVSHSREGKESGIVRSGKKGL